MTRPCASRRTAPSTSVPRSESSRAAGSGLRRALRRRTRDGVIRSCRRDRCCSGSLRCSDRWRVLAIAREPDEQQRDQSRGHDEHARFHSPAAFSRFACARSTLTGSDANRPRECEHLVHFVEMVPAVVVTQHDAEMIRAATDEAVVRFEAEEQTARHPAARRTRRRCS